MPRQSRADRKATEARLKPVRAELTAIYSRMAAAHERLDFGEYNRARQEAVDARDRLHRTR